MKLKVFLIISLFLIDRISKEVMERTLTLCKHYPKDSIISFHLMHNYGGALGLNISRIILIFFSSIAILIFSFYLFRERRFSLYLSLILGGILGNLYDRIFYGYVVDFISIWKFPVFNIADCFISIGMFFIIINLLKK
jgi:signal peptidase II